MRQSYPQSYPDENATDPDWSAATFYETSDGARCPAGGASERTIPLVGDLAEHPFPSLLQRFQSLGASGTLLALLQDRVKSRFTEIFVVAAVLFALTAPASFLIAQTLPFNALAVVWDPATAFFGPTGLLADARSQHAVALLSGWTGKRDEHRSTGLGQATI